MARALHREARMFGWDLRYAVRALLKTPGFVVMALLTIAVSTGLTTALFSVLDGVLFRPLPYKDPQQLTILWETTAQNRDISVAYQNFNDWRNQTKTFEDLAASRLDDFNLSGHGQAERVRGRMVSSNFFSTLGIHPILGRNFRPDEDRVEASPAAILNYRLWKQLYQKDPNVVGKTLKINDRSFTIIGVMPESFHIFTEVQIFVPMGLFAKDWPTRDTHPGIYVIGRLKQDVTLQTAAREMKQIALRLQKQYPDTNHGTIRIHELEQQITGDVRSGLWLLFGAVIFVLLIACANIANMMIARGISRQKEISIRMALGASRKDLIREFLLESMLIAFAGGFLGLFLAENAHQLLLWLRPESIPRLDDIQIDRAVLAFSLGISALSGVLFGLLPAFQSSGFDLNQSIQSPTGQLPIFRGHYRLRSLLVISQVGLSLLLLIGAGLMTKSIYTLMKSNTGFESEHLLTIQLSLSQQKYQGQQVLSYLKEAEHQILQVPGVQAFAFSNGLPIAGANEGIFWVHERPRPRSGEEFPAVQYLVSPNYLQTMKIPLLKGRYFSPADTAKQAAKCIIDEALAKKYFPHENPIGQHLRIDMNFPPFEIVGIAGHVQHYGLDATPPIEPEFYIPIYQIPDQYLSEVGQDLHLLIRTAGDPTAASAAIRNALKNVDVDQATATPITMKMLISDSFAARRFSMVLLSIFAVVALFLAAAGIYAVLSYMVTQRSKEIGIRMAIGAKKTDVLKLVLRGGFRMIFTGLLIGILTSIALSRLLATQFYAVSPTDPPTILLISALLTFVGLIATYVPAARAAKIDPLTILKQQ